MITRAEEAAATVCEAADLLISTSSPVEIAAALRAQGLELAADRFRYLGVAVALHRAVSPPQADPEVPPVLRFPTINP